MRDYKTCDVGPGGLHCGCCNGKYCGRTHGMKRAKSLINRENRRRNKIDLKIKLETD